MGIGTRWYDYSPGILEQHNYQPVEGDVIVRNTQDVEPILEHNKRLKRDAEEGNGGYTPSRDMRRVASIPNVVILKWFCEEGINVFNDEHWPWVASRKLDDPEYEYLRTAPGRVSQRAHREHPSTRAW